MLSIEWLFGYCTLTHYLDFSLPGNSVGRQPQIPQAITRSVRLEKGGFGTLGFFAHWQSAVQTPLPHHLSLTLPDRFTPAVVQPARPSASIGRAHSLFDGSTLVIAVAVW